MSKGGTVGGILVRQQQNGIMNGPEDWVNQTPTVERRPRTKGNKPTPVTATIAKSMSPSANRQNHQRRRNGSAKQLYRKYVNKSNLFAESPASKSQLNLGGARWQIGGVPNGAPFRMSDSMPSPNQLEWQKQRRAHTRQLAMNAPGSLNGPKIVQKHAEMRSYLLHCQRVLNARPRVDTGRPTGRSAASSSSITSPSVTSLRGEFVGPKLRQNRARSVPANADNRKRPQLTGIERELQEENRRLLERLVQMRINDGFGGNGFDSLANSQHQSRQSTGQNNHRQTRIQTMASRRKGIEDEEEGDETGNDDI